MVIMAKMPEYFEKNGYTNPDDQNSGPPQYGHDMPGQNLWPFIAANPKLLNAAHAFFESDRGNRPLWVDWFPVQQKLLNDSSRPLGKDGILYVDIGGGRGHDLLDFKRKFGAYPGRYVLMDLPLVVDDETLQLPGVEKRAFNFFENQVVPGERYRGVHGCRTLTGPRCSDILYEIHSTRLE